MPSNTANYNLILYDRTADENQQFVQFREDIAGTIASSNMNKIDNQLKINSDSINNIAGAGRTTETVKQNADNVEQLKYGVIHEVTTIGTDTYGGTSSTINSCYNGQKIILKPANDNTGDSTLNINGLGAKSLRKIIGGSEVELESGDLKQNQPQLFEYNGTSWIAIGSSSEGDMASGIYDPNNIQNDVFDMTNMINGGIKKVGNGYALDMGLVRAVTELGAVDLSFTDNDNTKGAIGLYAFAVGHKVLASGESSHSEGNYATASGKYSHAEGAYTTASGTSSHAEGSSTEAVGFYAHAEGAATEAIGNFSHAEGDATVASGESSHAEGGYTIASGNYSHAEGDTTEASRLSAHAEGGYTIADGDYSHAQNYRTTAQGYIQTTIGKYNIVQGTPNSYMSTDHAFIIGNGVDDANRSNALTVNWQGDLWTAGEIEDGSGNVLSNKENIANKGIANGYAELDDTGKIPSSQLPSFVDDVLEYADFESLPATGENGKIYITIDDNKSYRWTGSIYGEISSSLALGETSSTAYRGDRGRIAYDHSQLPHNYSLTGHTHIVSEVTDFNPVDYLPLTGGTMTGVLDMNGKDLYLSNGALVVHDNDGGAFSDRSGSNIDHIWHDDSTNAWNFVSDSTYKATGNSRINAGSFYANGNKIWHAGNDGAGSGLDADKVHGISFHKDAVDPSGTTRLNMDGYLYATRVYNAVYNDLAEFMEYDPSEEDLLEPGDVLVLGDNGLERSKKSNDKKVVGVLSDTYGFALGSKGLDDLENDFYKIPIGISGRVLVKLDLEDGQTPEKGDLLVSGLNGKAIINNESTLGTIIGKIYDNTPNQDGRYWMLIMTS